VGGEGEGEHIYAHERVKGGKCHPDIAFPSVDYLITSNREQLVVVFRWYVFDMFFDLFIHIFGVVRMGITLLLVGPKPNKRLHG
jgi:hypothetical protein